MIKYRKLCLLLVISLFVMSTVAAPLAEACTYKEGKKPKVDVKFKGWKKTSEGYRFTYEVQSGAGNERIKFWTLYSKVFAKYNVISASESYTETGTYIKFTTGYSNNQKRTVWFVVGKGYKPIKLGQVCISVKTQTSTKYFWRPGPSSPWK